MAEKPEDEIPEFFKFDTTNIRKVLKVEATLVNWLAIHGYLCLALRHPGTLDVTGTRSIVVEFVHDLGRKFVGEGIISQEGIEALQRIEANIEETNIREKQP